jgi:hypothetical protein
MKTRMIKRISAITLTILLGLGSTGFAKSGETSEATQLKESRGCSVPQSEIVLYLEGFGYSNITFYKGWDPCNITVATDYEYDTIVHLSGSSIIGHDDDDGEI